MKVSGAYRITLMEQNNRKYCLISDVHIDAKGCEDDQSVQIKDFLKDVFQNTNYKILYLLEYSIGMIPQDSQGFMVELFSQSYKCFIKPVEQYIPQRLPEKENVCSSNVSYEAIDIRQCKNGTIFKSWETHNDYDIIVNKIYRKYQKYYKNLYETDNNVCLYHNVNTNDSSSELSFDSTNTQIRRLQSFIGGEMLTSFIKICCEPLIKNDSQILLKNELLSFKRNNNEKFIKAWFVCCDYVYRLIYNAEREEINENVISMIRRLLGVIAVDLYAIAKLEGKESKDINNIIMYAGKDHIDNYINYIELYDGKIIKDEKSSREKRCINVKDSVSTFFNQE